MPSALHLAAVDLGATSGRVMLATWAEQRLSIAEVHRFPNTFRTLGAHSYWELGTLWDEVQHGLRNTVAVLPPGGRLRSAGIDTWGVDTVLVNESGRLVFPPHAYRDLRTQRGLERLNATPGAMERIYAATGIPNIFYNTSLQLAELLTNCPAIRDQADRCLFLPDYFNFLLSGRMENEFTVASTSQLLDVHTGDWSQVALDHFQIPAKWFRTPIRSSVSLGPVKTCRELRSVELIAVPGHDTACAYDAMPAAPDRSDVFISSGTWSLVGFESQRPLLGPEALAASIGNERTADGGYRPLTSVMGLWLMEKVMETFPGRPCSEEEWRELCDAAEKLPSPQVLLDVADPAFINPENMREAIDAHLRSRGAAPPANLVGYARVIFDSLGNGHAQAIRRLERLSGHKFRRVLVVGGGSKNRLLCQATANAIQVPVISFALEGTVIGNLARQLIAIGAVEDLPTFRASLAEYLVYSEFLPDGAAARV